MKVALLGAAGYWAKNVYRVLQDTGVEIKYFCDPIKPNFVDVNRKWIKTPDKIWKDSEIGAVFIITPPESHVELATDAMFAGKHVFLEKPMALNILDAKLLVQCAEQRKKLLVLDHTFLQSSEIVYLKHLLGLGLYGRPLFYESTRSNWGPFKNSQSTDVLHDLLPHDFSILDHLFGMPNFVSAQAFNVIDGCDTDVTVNCFYEDGLRALIRASFISDEKVRKIKIIFEKAIVTVDFNDEFVKFKKRAATGSGFDLIDSHRITRFGEPLKLGIEHFLSLAEKNIHTYTESMYGGLNTIKLIEATQQSVAQSILVKP